MNEKISIVLIAVLLLAGCAKQVNIRPINLKVIDKTTKEPIENLVVYYVLQVYSAKNTFMFIKLPEPKQKTRTIIQQEVRTDKKGEVKFKGSELVIGRNENIYEENIYLNLDINTEKIDYEDHKKKDKLTNFNYYFSLYATDSDKFFNTNKQYKGYQIKSTTWGLIPEDWGGTVRDKFDVLFNSQGLLKSEDDFVIELKRN